MTQPAIDPQQAKEYLKSIKPTAERVEQFTRIMSPAESMQHSNGWTYDADLGWVHCDWTRRNGVNNSASFYHYEADGARKVVNFPDQPCRIHAYGDSFTSCEQVNDGETWEEYLAAHLQEPIRNYGVGGYSVYQAYLRMLKVEAQSPAEYIIFNIWDDDHYRNLDAWRSIRFGTGSDCGFTLPHLRVDVAQNRCDPLPNLIRSREDVNRLRDNAFLWDTFKDDPILHGVLALRMGASAPPQLANPVAVSFGIPEEFTSNMETARQIRAIHTQAAFFSTQHIIGWLEDFLNRHNKKLMLLLTYRMENISSDLQGSPRFDQSFLDFLKDKPYPVIDMRDIYREQYVRFNGPIADFLEPFFIGHHTPRGNFLLAWGIKEALVNWLTPPPSPYAT